MDWGIEFWRAYAIGLAAAIITIPFLGISWVIPVAAIVVTFIVYNIWH